MKLTDRDVTYLNQNTIDPLGRVFEYNGKIYRGIYKSQEKFFWEIWNNGLLKELIDSRIIPYTDIAQDVHHEEYSIVLTHEKIIYTDPTEWTFSMLRDVAAHILKTNSVCNKYGYELLDAHPYNLSFKENSPLFIDIGGITPKTNIVWSAKPEFLIYTIFPLILMQNGYLTDAYMLLSSITKIRLSFSDFTKTISFQHFVNLMNSLGINNINEHEFDENWIRNLKPVENDHNKSIWSSYSTEDIKNYKDIVINVDSTRYKRIKKIAEFIDKFCSDASSLIDLGGNVGLTSMIIKTYSLKTNLRFINVDYDYFAIENSYSYLKSNNVNYIESYLLNCIHPLTQFNLKLKSDIAIALALTHHLMLVQKRTLDEIFQKISEYTNKYIIIEFMPLGLWGGDQNNLPEIPTWYNTNFFKEKFEKYFDILHFEAIEKQLILGEMRDHRVAFVGIKKNI